MNLDFLLPHTAHFDNSIVLLLKGYKTLGVFFSYFKQYDTIVLYLRL